MASKKDNLCGYCGADVGPGRVRWCSTKCVKAGWRRAHPNVSRDRCRYCEHPAHARRMCRRHYQRWYVYGDPLREPSVVPLADRLWRHIEITDDCWFWTASLDGKGYGQLNVNRRPRRAHRLVYELLVGPIPARLQLDHLCHNRDTTCAGGPSCRHRRCVNPAHLEPVTNAQNCRRGRRADRAA
jgi:hypothetical protein